MLQSRNNLRLFGLDLGSFFRWWGEGLSRGLPAGLASAIRGDVPRLVMYPEKDVVAVTWRNASGGESSLGEYPASSRPRIELPREAHLVELRLPDDEVLGRELDLPAAAQANLRQAVRFQLPRLTPFSAKELAFDAVVTGQAQGRVRVCLSLLPLERMQAWATHVEAVWGSVPAVVRGRSDPPGINLVAPGQRPGLKRPLWPITTLAGGLLALSVAVPAIPVVQKWQVAEAQDGRIENLRVETRPIMEKRDRLDMAAESFSALREAHAASPAVLQLLEELTTLLPDHTVLDNLEMTSGELRIEGFSRDAAGMIGRLEGSPRLHDVQFVSTVRREPGTALERFELEARFNDRGAD